LKVEEVHPFIGARQVNQVWIDAQGNAVLSTAISAGNFTAPREYVVIAPVAAAGTAPLNLVKVEETGVELKSGGPAHAGSTAPSAFSSVELQNGQLILRWSGSGVLQRADRVEGPWSDVEAAGSPFPVPPNKGAEFFRVR
jgi:hypothetical protein